MRAPGFLLGRLFGTDIYVTGGFFILLLIYFVLIGSAGPAAIFCLAVVLSLLVHEFGHVFAVKWFLRGESAVVLWGLGGLCVHEPTEAPKKRLGISLMGPAFEAVLGALSVAAYLLVPAQPVTALSLFLKWMVWINVVWVAANLLPIMPLDGGHALRAVLEMRLPRGRATAIMRRVSITVAVAGTATALYFERNFAAVIGILLLLHNLPGGSRPR